MGDGRKRRLPPWMRGVAANKSDDGVLIRASTPNFQPSASNSGIAHCQREEVGARKTLVVKSILPSKCGTKQRKRKLKLQDEDDGGDARGADSFEVSAPQKGRKKRNASNARAETTAETGIPCPIDDEGELTMEDLMSIAQEYVDTDKAMKQHKLNSKECELEREFPATNFSRNVTGGSLDAAEKYRRSPAQDTETSLNSTMISAGEVVSSNPSRTGDAAEDMLDLFLGPLLKRPQEEKRQFEFILEDMEFAHEFKERDQSDVVNEMAPLTKKKSSLKDKVAAFLD